MDITEIAELIQAGERRNVEFKSGGPLTEQHLLARVTRAILALANTRGGGLVLIGVGEIAGAPNVSGIDAVNLATWTFDDLTAKVASYADPYVSFDMELINVEGATIIGLRVNEFEEVPVLCKKAYDTPGPNIRTVLKKGAVYVRGRPKPESIEVSSVADMRELIDLAVEKQLANFARKIGISGVGIAAEPIQPVVADLYAQERGGF